MTVLVFRHDGYTVVSSSWTMASKGEQSVDLCYTWGPDRFSWGSTAVGTARVKVNLSMADFLTAISKGAGGVVDLCKWTP